MSSYDNDLNSGIDAVIIEDGFLTIMSDAIKQNAAIDQVDLTASSTLPVISIYHDLKIKRQYCTNRCTNTIDEDNYFYILAGKTTKTTFFKIYIKFE